MAMEVATSTEMKNNFGKYLNMVMNGNEIIVTKNGKPVGRFVPTDQVIEYLTDSLTSTRLLIDANVLLDVLMKREPFYKDSAIVWKLCETGISEGVVSALTFADIVYVMRKELSPEWIHDTLTKLSMISAYQSMQEKLMASLAKADAAKQLSVKAFFA